VRTPFPSDGVAPLPEPRDESRRPGGITSVEFAKVSRVTFLCYASGYQGDSERTLMAVLRYSRSAFDSKTNHEAGGAQLLYRACLAPVAAEKEGNFSTFASGMVSQRTARKTASFYKAPRKSSTARLKISG
jgi:hypothetical protein